MSIVYRSVHHAGRPSRALATLSLLFSVGCVSSERYILDRTAAEQLAPNVVPPDERMSPQGLDYVAAVREKDRRPVFVKTSALRKDTLTPLSPDSFRIEARGYNRLVTAGSILTWVGTAVSLAGTVIVAVAKREDNTPLFYAGGITALAAEPMMWTGTGLWIYGALRLPFEKNPPQNTPTAGQPGL
ncbi:MAG TPA: hypothetical protein PK472_17405 [Pseudomonadota bacterium]|nr:hypothetical protein [Pseudomonadota bacterium]